LGQALVTANCLSSEQLSRALIVQSLIRDGIMDTYVGLAKLSSSKPILANETLNATVKTIKTRSESQERMATLRRESEARLATVRKDSESRMPTMRLSDSRLATVRGSDSRLSTVRNTKESDYRFSIYRKSN
jgi:GTP1/Obg family GTP-binding protein